LSEQVRVLEIGCFPDRGARVILERFDAATSKRSTWDLLWTPSAVQVQ
jgi:hypothetical protein